MQQYTQSRINRPKNRNNIFYLSALTFFAGSGPGKSSRSYRIRIRDTANLSSGYQYFPERSHGFELATMASLNVLPIKLPQMKLTPNIVRKFVGILDGFAY